MSDTIQAPQSLTYEPLGYRANHSPTDDPDKPRQLETYANELTTNIIRKASRTASRNPDEDFDDTGMDNTNELNFPRTSKQNQPENTTTNGIHDENDFDDDIQRKMSGVIHDIQSRSGSDINTSRKSVTFSHLHDDQINNSTPTIIDPVLNNSTEGPLRSMSESALVDHHILNEQSLPLPVRQDESSSDADDILGIKSVPTNTTTPFDDFIDQHRSDQENHIKSPLDDNDDFFNMKTATIDDDQRPTTAIKQNGLDETARFGTTSSPRVQSAASKRLVHTTPDEPSTSGDDKRANISPSKLPDDADNDTDIDNREVATIARRPSRAMSPLNRPRSPTPNDSRKMSINNEPPALRRQSINKIDQQQTFQPTSAIKSGFDENSFEPSTGRPSSSHTNQFITTNEQLQIPIDDFDNQQSNSPPPLSTDVKSLVLINPLLGSSLVSNEQEQSSLPSETNRNSPTTSMISNEKVIDGDVLPSKIRRDSTISQQQTNNTDQKSTSRRGSLAVEQTPQISSSRRASTSQQQDELDSHRQQQVASRRTSNVPQEPTSRRGSIVPEQQTSNRRESTTLEQQPSSRRGSTAPEQQPSNRRASIADEQKTFNRRESIAEEPQVWSKRESIVPEQQPSSRRGSIAPDQPLSNRRGSVADEQKTFNRRESIADEPQVWSKRESVAAEQQPSSRRGSVVPDQQLSNRRASVADEQKTFNRRESITDEPQVWSKRESIVPEQQPSSRRGSIAPEQQPSNRRGSVADEQKTFNRRESIADEPQVWSKRESIAAEQQPSSRRESTAPDQQLSNRRASVADEQKTFNRRESIAAEQQPSSRRGSIAPDQQLSNRRESVADEQKNFNRRESIAAEQQPSSRRGSIVPEQQLSNRRASVADEQKTFNRRESITDEPQVWSKGESIAAEQQPSSRRGSIAPDQQLSDRRGSVANGQKTFNRRESITDEPQVWSKRESIAAEQQLSSRRESIAAEQQLSSRRESIADQQKTSNRRESTTFEQKPPSRRESAVDEQKTTSRKGSAASEQQPSSRRGSVAPEQQISHRRESINDQQKIANRRGSTAFEQQVSSRRGSHISEQQIASRRESQQQGSPSRRTSTNRDNQTPSPRRPSLNISDTNHQQIRHESHQSSDTDNAPTRTSAKNKQERTSSIDKRQKSSSTADENDRRRLSFQRRSGQESKRNSKVITDETIVTPIIMDSSKIRQHNEKRTSTADTSFDQTSTSKLPSVSSPFQNEKHRRSETLNKQQMPTSNQSQIKHLSSSHATTPSDDEKATHWTKQIIVPSIHLTDDEISLPREDQPRPQSPNVEQIAERNQPPPPPSPPLITTSSGKKRSAADGKKSKEQNRNSRRSTSADTLTNIQLVDDKSLDSTSENNTDFDRHKRRHVKPKRKDAETNTDQIFDSQQRSFFDEKELAPQKPLKATKPMSDHLHSTRRRAPNKEQILTTPDTIPDSSDTPTFRRTVKQTKDSNQDKEPVHVNVTVVVKKFAGTTKDGKPNTTAEAFVEQKPQQYFESVQHPPEILPPPITENREKSVASSDRPKSTGQQRMKSSEQKILEHPDRHTQSDTEQIITDKQKKRRRPKRISRTSQTYECVFRRMERDQHQDLRATSDTEKNIQTRESQLRPRKKSPKKNHPVYLSTDSFRLEELLPKQYHQSRRNMSKSSSIARSLSPQGGKLLILRPTLPFHHTDAVNVHRVCLQYAIDLVPNESFSSGTTQTNRNKLTVLKQSEQTNSLPMISASSSGVNVPTNKSNIKDKSASSKSEDHTHQRKNGGAV